MYSETYRVDFRDVDKNSDIKMSALLQILGTVATKHSNSVGVDPFYLTRNDMAWILYEWHIDMNIPKLYTKNIRIETFVCDKKAMSAYRYFVIYDEDENIIATVTSVWVVVDMIKRKMKKMPQELCDIYKKDLDLKEIHKNLIEKHQEKMIVTDKKMIEKDIKIGYYDLDANMHVSNTIYPVYLINTLVEDKVLDEVKVKKLDIVYKKECKFEEKNIVLKYIKDDDNIHCEMYDKKGSLLNIIKLQLF